MPKRRYEPTFLCSSCRTEQLVATIIHDQLKVCLCPNCEQVCCDDYCVFFANGRYDDIPEPYVPDNAPEQDYRHAQVEYDKARAQQREAYESTRKEYGLS